MRNTRKNVITKALAIVVAMCLVVTASVLSRNTSLKASEEVQSEAVIEEGNGEIYEPMYEPDETWTPDEETPVIVTEEVQVEEIEEIESAEELTEEPADRQTEEVVESAAEDICLDLEVNIWFEFPEGNNGEGSTLVFKSEVPNAPDWMTLHYTWQYDRGNGWEEVPGGNEAECVTVLNRETATCQWRLEVYGD